MPLYMDYHKFPGITLETARNAHTADTKIQSKHDVTYHKYWVNEDAGAVFCLVEGPDKESCEKVHRYAHGDLPCAMVELDPEYYELIMGKNQLVDRWGQVHHQDGRVDPGYRSVIAVDMHIVPLKALPRAPDPSFISKVTEVVQQQFTRFFGRPIRRDSDDFLCGVFNNADSAMHCAREIQHQLLDQYTGKEQGWHVPFSIGIGAGQPVTEHEDFFVETMRLTRMLSVIAPENQILVSWQFAQLCEEEDTDLRATRNLEPYDERIMTHLFKITDVTLSGEILTIDALCHDLGISRNRFSRVLKKLTGKSPTDLLKHIRLNKAYSILIRESRSIKDVAHEVGIKTPSSFSRSFTSRFGIAPSKFTRAMASTARATG